MPQNKKGAKKTVSQQGLEQGEVPKGKEEESGALLEEFWGKFQLSPNSFEHTILSSPIWMSLVALVPILGLILSSYLMALQEAEASTKLMEMTFADLRDPIFTTVTLALWFGALLYTTQWYPNISKTFRSLFINGVLFGKDEKIVAESDYVDFLKEYLKGLHSRKRYIMPLIFTVLMVGSTIWITAERGYWQWFIRDGIGVLDRLHMLTRWIIAPLAWGYLGGFALWTVTSTIGTVKRLTPHFQINVQPLHSDRAGGLKKIGDLCSQVGLTILVILVPVLFLSVRGTANMINTYLCGSELSTYAVNRLAPMTEERFARCVYYSQGGALEGLRVIEILEEVNGAIGSGTPLQTLVSNYYARYEEFFRRDSLMQAYDIYLVMDFFLIVILVFSVFIFIVPMWDIHRDMLGSRQRREQEANNRIGSLYNELTGAIKVGKLDKANTIRSDIKFFVEELTEIQKYPVWPVSFLPVLRSYLTSGLLSTLVTYIFSLLNIAISPEAQAIFDKIIPPS